VVTAIYSFLHYPKGFWRRVKKVCVIQGAHFTQVFLTMSNIAALRLQEERKAWRKDTNVTHTPDYAVFCNIVEAKRLLYAA
jgi:hypothetical protein